MKLPDANGVPPAYCFDWDEKTVEHSAGHRAQKKILANHR